MKKIAIFLLVSASLVGLSACAAKTPPRGFLAVKVCVARQCPDASGKPGPKESGAWKSVAELGRCECLAWEFQTPGIQR